MGHPPQAIAECNKCSHKWYPILKQNSSWSTPPIDKVATANMHIPETCNQPGCDGKVIDHRGNVKID